MGNLEDIFGSAIRSASVIPKSIVDSGEKQVKNLENGIAAQITGLTDPKTLISTVGNYVPPLGFSLSLEYGTHLYMRADAERRILRLANKVNLKTVIEKLGGVYVDPAALQTEEAKTKSLTEEGYVKLKDFWDRVLGANNTSESSLFKLQYRYLFNVSMRFNALTEIPHSPKTSYKNKTVSSIRDPNQIFTLFSDIQSKFMGNAQTIALLARAAVLPNFTGSEEQKFTNQFGYMSLPSDRIIPDENKLVLSFLTCEYPINEIFFLEWIKETCADTYLYLEQPFQKADITIDFIDQKYEKIIYSYTFVDAYPKTIITPDVEHEVGGLDFSRDVVFSFDYVIVNPNFYQERYALPTQ